MLLPRLAVLFCLSMPSLLSCGQMQPGDDVAGELREQSGSRLRRQAWVASDGTVSYTVGYFDTKLQKGCQFRMAQGAWRCLPDGPDPADLTPYVSARIAVE